METFASNRLRTCHTIGSVFKFSKAKKMAAAFQKPTDCQSEETKDCMASMTKKLKYTDINKRKTVYTKRKTSRAK